MPHMPYFVVSVIRLAARSNLGTMKLICVLFCALLLVCLSEQKARYTNCSEHIKQTHSYKDRCVSVTCHGDNGISMLPCAPYLCQEEIGYKEEDNSKVYPACCGGPICKR